MNEHAGLGAVNGIHMIGKFFEALNEGLVVETVSDDVGHWWDQCNHSSYNNQNKIHPKTKAVDDHPYCFPVLGKSGGLILPIKLE